MIDGYFDSGTSLNKGLPGVELIAGQLNISPGYLSDLLRNITGQNTQQYIQYRLIEKSKELLSTSTMTVSEIAYQLGFGYSQSFSKLFKKVTSQTPLAYRKLFN
nr:helix-turn-helix transcriptional regulator [Niabella hibiscisoli]